MTKKILINITKVNENGDIYFLATSNDIQGFMVEGNTIDEIIEFSPSVAMALISEKQKRQDTRNTIKNRIDSFLNKKLEAQYSFTQNM